MRLHPDRSLRPNTLVVGGTRLLAILVPVLSMANGYDG